MKPIFFSFFFFLVLLSVNTAYAETINAYLLAPGEDSFADDEVILDNNETLDLDPIEIPLSTQTIGGQEIELTQEVTFIADDEDVVKIKNTALPNIVVEIPDDTRVKAPDSWNGEITPPKSVSTSGTITGNFLTPTSSILVGSPDVILVFDTPVTIVLNGTTGTTAYKTPGSTEWIIISGCTGTFENPNNPPVNGECSIGDGTNTKIVTYHFTEFTGLTTPAPETSTTTGNSGGHGNTGVGSPRIFGSSGGSSGIGYSAPTQSSGTLPVWFDDVISWYREGKISATEFLNAYQWIIENV